MNLTIVSWTKFCEWVQGKKAVCEKDKGSKTFLTFEDGSEAVFHSCTELRFGEARPEPPLVEIKEKSP